MILFARYATAGLAVLVGSLAAHAQVSDNVVKIGILNDQSGVYADFGGKWSVEAARLAVGDFGGKVLPEFKRSSQHLERGGCDDCSEAAFGSVLARRLALAWSALCCAA